MDRPSQEGKIKKKVTEIKTFHAPFALNEINEKITISNNIPSNHSKEQIINKAFKFHAQGNISEAEKCYKKFIDQGFTDYKVFSNYGAILHDQKKLKEAELSFRKAIELNPNYAIAYSNLGNILRGLDNLKEAELSYRKAIKINPNFAEGNYNLGNILNDLGNLKEAELSYRKAIELNPNYTEAHNNLGSILNDLGNLKEAELSYRKAIELNPNYANARSNLGLILRDLGKYEELILLTQSTIKSNSINQGHKLIARFEIAIAYLLRGDFAETFLNINKTNDLIKEGLHNTIKEEKKRKNILNYSRFINSLYPLLEKKKKNPDSERIPHFGESHCLSFAHQTLSIYSQSKQIQPVLITGGKAWHFANDKNNQWKDSLNQQLKNHKYSDTVFISFGEIDCRKDEGILNYAIKNDINISEVCKKTIQGYLNHMEEMLSPNYSKKYYFGVPAPAKEKESLDELDIKRIEIVRIYNSIFKKEVLLRESYFLDVYKLTANKHGINNNIYMCDKIHLAPKCLSTLFENYLYKG